MKRLGLLIVVTACLFTISFIAFPFVEGAAAVVLVTTLLIIGAAVLIAVLSVAIVGFVMRLSGEDDE